MQSLVRMPRYSSNLHNNQRQFVRMLSRLLCLFLAAMIVTGCATTAEEREQRRRDQSAQQLYASARESMQVGNWKTAIEKLENLDSRYPFGPFSQQAQLDLMYAYYQNRDTPSAVAAADRFIRQNPRHPNLDYVYYMKGLVNYYSELGFLREAFAASLSERDASTAEKAFKDFSELIKLYPDSQYAADARQRMIYLRNRLADFELHAATYYTQRKAWLAAANRARNVIEHFPNVNATADALVMLVQCYRELNLPELEKESHDVLALNFPDRLKDLEG